MVSRQSLGLRGAWISALLLAGCVHRQDALSAAECTELFGHVLALHGRELYGEIIELNPDQEMHGCVVSRREYECMMAAHDERELGACR